MFAFVSCLGCRAVGLLGFVTLILILTLWCSPISAETSAEEKTAPVRVALVIGNSSYAHVPQLPNPTNDAADIAGSLRRIGFDVVEEHDLDYRHMRLAVRDFAKRAETADVAVVYYAGHGIEIENTNYLIPVKAELKRAADVEFEALRLDTLVSALEAPKGLKIVLIDACRDNPFKVAMQQTGARRSIGRGLARVEPSGVLVGYAAKGGTYALDGEARNSPFAEALLQHLETPGLELGKLFRKVRDTVFGATGGLQEPFVYGSLPGRDIFLVEPVALIAPIEVAPEPTPAPEPETKLTAQPWPLLQNVPQTNLVPLDQPFAPPVVEEAEESPEQVAALPRAAGNEQIISTDFALATEQKHLAGWRSFLQKYSNYPEHPLVVLAASKVEILTLDQDIARGYRVSEPWLATAIQGDGANVELTRSDRRLIQHALNMMGFDTGGVDGQFGPRSRSAIAKARAKAGLTPGNRVDVALLKILPNAEAVLGLRSETARSYQPEDLPESLEPRLRKALLSFAGKNLVFDYFGGHLYLVISTELTGNSWRAASNKAREAGGYLVAINSRAENDFLVNLFSGDPRFIEKEWNGAQLGPTIGLYQADRSREPAGGWEWDNGDPLTFKAWSPGNPDNYRGRQHIARFYLKQKMNRPGARVRYWDDGTSGYGPSYIVEIE